MNGMLTIEAKWEHLEKGSPEERACFAALGIRYGNHWLTEADDQFVGRVRHKVHLSAYRLAEWLAWNWWRLRWEPRPQADKEGWALAHRMTTIGGGYVWPNITVMSDGERVGVLARPTNPCPAEPLRYIADFAAVIRASEFEGAVDSFIGQVREQLRATSIAATNLDSIWDEVLRERQDGTASAQRRLEATLGFDPDEADPSLIDQLMADAEQLGSEAVAELAADRSSNSAILSATAFRTLAREGGRSANIADIIRLAAQPRLAPRAEIPAWCLGAELARDIRTQAGLGSDPLSDVRLAEFAAVSPEILSDRSSNVTFSFALDETATNSRIVLRSKWRTTRRFELARLLGDRIGMRHDDRLLPATRVYTYRQKLQRSFAAYLLCPFEALQDHLEGDYSPKAIEDAADHFEVSEFVVRTLLVNHGVLDRAELASDFEYAAAA